MEKRAQLEWQALASRCCTGEPHLTLELSSILTVSGQASLSLALSDYKHLPPAA